MKEAEMVEKSISEAKEIDIGSVPVSCHGRVLPLIESICNHIKRYGRGGKITHIFLNPKQYKDLRCYDRMFLDIETRASILKAGIMAQLHKRGLPKAYVFVRNEISEGEITIAYSDNDGSKNLYKIEV